MSKPLLAPSNDLPDRVGALDADELLVEAAVEVGQLVRVEAHLLQHGRVQVLDVEPVLDRVVAQLVGRPDAQAALDAAAGRPHREPVGVVVAAGARGVLRRRLPAELAAPDHDRALQQPAPLQVLQEPRDRLVGVPGVLVVVQLDVGVGVPVVVVVVPAAVAAAPADTCGRSPRSGCRRCRRGRASRVSPWRSPPPPGRAAAS